MKSRLNNSSQSSSVSIGASVVGVEIVDATDVVFVAVAVVSVAVAVSPDVSPVAVAVVCVAPIAVGIVAVGAAALVGDFPGIFIYLTASDKACMKVFRSVKLSL